MRKMLLLFGIYLLFLSSFTSCEKNLIEYKQGDLKIRVEKGENWLHDFPLFLGIDKKNPPQIAIWTEDKDSNYLSTIYVSYKTAHQAWQSAGKSRRKEALPYWSHKRGVIYEDGLYMPTKKNPLAYGVTGATPTGSFNLKVTPAKSSQHFLVFVEINHSTDFNDNYPKSAKEGNANYSGGKEGSGQPALVYCADVDLSTGKTSFEANLIGHSSPDGTNGNLYSDVSDMSSALHIVKHITINLQ
nr:hypothetical protein [Prevotella sp.]